MASWNEKTSEDVNTGYKQGKSSVVGPAPIGSSLVVGSRVSVNRLEAGKVSHR